MNHHTAQYGLTLAFELMAVLGAVLIATWLISSLTHEGEDDDRSTPGERHQDPDRPHA